MSPLDTSPLLANPRILPPLKTRVTLYGCEVDEIALLERFAPHLGVEALATAEPVSETTASLAQGSLCISVNHKTHVSRGMLQALARAGVSYISTRSVGYDHIDTDAAASMGLSVENVSYPPESVAEYTLMLIMMTLRRAKETIRRTDAHDYRLPSTCGKNLSQLTVGVVGTGHIGTAVIERLRGFGCRIMVASPRDGAAQFAELLHRSDVVTLHIPLTPANHHLINREKLALMKPDAMIVNTGRGALIDTTALLDALESGTLGGAALDVLEGEQGIFYTDCRSHLPHSALARLQKLPNVLISPHAAYYTESTLEEIVKNSLLNCKNFESEATSWLP